MNGTVGIVVDCKVPFVNVKVDSEVHEIGLQDWIFPDIGIRKQYPIIPSYALTIHKCQGMTIKKLYVDLAGVFLLGMCMWHFLVPSL